MQHAQPNSKDVSRDTDHWAEQVSRLTVSGSPRRAISLNVEGRDLAGPLQGFGPLWQKTYKLRLTGADVTPAEVVRVWKEHFPEFHPPQNRFFPPVTGITPGQVVLLNASVNHLPVATGLLVLYSDDESFTLMTPQGFPEAGWNTFSAYVEDGVTVAQVESYGRASDPVYEVFYRLFAARAQERIWQYVLRSLGSHFGVQGQVETKIVCLDPRLQWREARNILYNAGLRTAIYVTTRQITRIRVGSRRRVTGGTD